MNELPNRARIVIIGAGIVGCSAAYHLAKQGWRDIVLVDQGPLFETGGSTSHAPGITFGTNPSYLMQKMVKYTTELLSELRFHGEPVWFPVGTIEVARAEERVQELWRRHGHATAYGTESHIITPEEVQAMVPLIDPSTFTAALYRPSDGNTKAWQAAGALAEAAMVDGAVVAFGHTRATDFELSNGRVNGVVTDRGTIGCEQALLCTNIWGSVLADKLGVTLPMMACSHHYGITAPLSEYEGEMAWIQEPPLRYQEKSMYFRQWGHGYCVGSYRHEPWIVSPYQVGRDAYWEWQEEAFHQATLDALDLYPVLAGREYQTRVNGMFVFSVDGFPIMGPTHVPGFWTAIGIWVTHAGGAGKCIAEWLDHGTTEWDMREANVNRFYPHQQTDRYIRLRSTQNYREVYDLIHPLQQMTEPRNVRLAPYHQRLAAQKGHFFSVSGWEVAQWYEENSRLLEVYGEEVPERTGWEAIEWSRIQGAEHLAVREHAGLFNLASFTKVEVSGPGATDFLNHLAANNIDRPKGRIVYTALLNEIGNIKADLTITRLDEDRYWVLTGVGSGPQDLAWIRRHAPAEGVTIRDISSELTAVGLWGPKARQILTRVVSEDVSNEAFPYMRARELEIGVVPALALRLSYAGELGWEIYCRTELGLALWDTLWEAGQDLGLVAAGTGSFGSLRLEKGYRAWGADIHTEFNPYEAGLGWAVRLSKDDFLGKAALMKSREQGISRKLCCLTTNDPEAMALGREPILSMSGEPLGYVTSADYGYSVGKLILYGYLPLTKADVGNEVQIMYLDRRFAAEVTQEPLFDPSMERLIS